jgi:NAD-dependent SIR2 family protein deacetylase
MSAYYEIAFAAATHRLCLFTGTGFSKAVTENRAPSWQELLQNVCDVVPNGADLKTALFPAGGKNPLDLEEAAQVISLELIGNNKNIYDEIACQISTLKPSGDNRIIEKFLRGNQLRIVTTNYDKLAETLSEPASSHSITPGNPIPRAHADVEVFHVHGSVDVPESMVVTSDNYFKFMNGESYFSRKLSTMLHENTVVILGYSLGDTNLKNIINEYRGFARNHVIGGSLFLVSRNKVDQYVKDYYSHCYGIRVLDNTTVHKFFEEVDSVLPDISEETDSAIEAVKNVLLINATFVQSYIKHQDSFFEIVSSLAAIGRSIDDPVVVKMLDDVLKMKIKLTAVRDAWEQYPHLAAWLCYLGSILEMPGTSIQATYLDAVLKSMTTMSKVKFGYSWEAYSLWDELWPKILAPNRKLIRDFVGINTTHDDAHVVVSKK